MVIGLIATTFSPSGFADPIILPSPIVTVTSDYEKEVNIALRKNTDPVGSSCITPFILYPGQQKTIAREELIDSCKQAEIYMLDITRLLTHSFILKNIPAHCHIYLNMWHQVSAKCQ